MSDNRIFQALKALPLIRFALMLGGGAMMTGGAGWITAIIAYGAWPASVAPARIEALAWGLIGCLSIIGIVMVALAWGKADKIRIGFRGAEAEFDFEDEK